MACRTLLRRKAQLALLLQACDQRVHAHVRLRRKASPTGEVRLLALERDGVRATWMGDPIPTAEVPGQPVEVRFEHEGEPYVFLAVTRGRVGRSGEAHDAPPSLTLSLPLRVERARRRRELRLPLRKLPPIKATFTHVVDDRRQFQAQMTDISDGGVGVTAHGADVCQLHTGDLFWLDVEVPGAEARSEFVVRLVHLRPVKNTDKLAMGWAFQPTDDAADYEKCLRRLEALASQRPEPGDFVGTE